MIALVDYGAGNVRSVHKALEAVGGQVVVARTPLAIRRAERIVLPGVGAFGDCMRSLAAGGLGEALEEAVARHKPLLGICVGMQVMLEQGEELGRHAGLGLLPGRVVRFNDAVLEQGLKVPHTGWNQLQHRGTADPLFHGLPAGAWAYFNHAYYCRPRPEDVLATSDYGAPFASVIGRDGIYGVQFHPEKSQSVGLRILRNFVERVSA